MSTPPAQMPAARPKRSIPTWYYVAGGVVILGVAYLYKRSKASAATTPATASTAPVAAGGSTAGYNSADQLASLQSQLANLQGAASTPVGPTQIGSGYGTPVGTTPVPVTSSGGTYTQIGIQGQGQDSNIVSLINAGNTLYYQPAPGVFSPFNKGETGIAPFGVPVFVKS